MSKSTKRANARQFVKWLEPRVMLLDEAAKKYPGSTHTGALAVGLRGLRGLIA